VFSTIPSCSRVSVVFYHSVMHGLGFFILLNNYVHGEGKGR